MFRSTEMFRKLIPALALLAPAGFLLGQASPPAKPDLPSAATVMNRFVEVSGGKAAYDAIKTEHAVGSLEIAGAGIKGTIEVYSAAPDKSYGEVDITGVGKIEEGSNGSIAWENSVLQGARIKTGDEAAAAIRESAMDVRTNWQKYYKSAEVSGVETVDGKTCYKIVMQPLTGAPENDYYDKDSGLLVKQTSEYDTPMGKVPVEVTMSDYRKQGDLLMPFHVEQHLANQTFDTDFTKYEFNVAIPDSRFDLPAEIKALRK